jgi:hypothetical protein
MAFTVNNNQCKAGGIIAYTKKNDKIYFLMINNSKKIKNSDKATSYYEDPGGKFEKSDDSLIYGMCREFEEETSLLYYQQNNTLEINIRSINDLVIKSSEIMTKNIENSIKVIFLPKSKYALGFIEVDPKIMDLKINKYETLTEREKKENRSLEWIKSDKILYKKLHPRLFYNKNLIVDFLKIQGLIINKNTYSFSKKKLNIKIIN